MAVRRQIGLYNSPDEESGGGIGLLVSVLIHVALITMFVLNAQTEQEPDEQPLTFVELAQSLPQPPSESQRVVEAPGRESVRPPSPQAPLSDADRQSATPRPSGDRPTDRPGLVDAPFIPGSPSPGPPPSQSSPAVRPSEANEEQGERNDDAPATPADGFRFEERRSSKAPATAEKAPKVDWSSAIQDAGKVASLGGQELGTYGGDEGFAESGPISFETQWYEWGDYSNSMVRKIRYHWYNNMPALVRMGMKGVVVIRFTIQRDGTITDITILQSSTHPPFDFAARKAIELSSPLQPLPADFPKDSERVTAGFYYNMRPPTN